MPPRKSNKKGGVKKVSPYNEFMKIQLAKLKEEQTKAGKKVDHKENFKAVAAKWAQAPENPKNKMHSM